MTTQQKTGIREMIRLVADIATTLLVAILIGTFTLIRGHDRDIVRIDTNQKIVMGSVETMTKAINGMNERLSKAEAKIEDR